MRRTAALLAAGVLLAGCGAKSDLGAVAVESTTTTSSAQALPEADFLRLVRELPWIVDTVDDATLLRMADTTCQLLTGESIRGPMNDPVTWLPWKQVVQTMTKSGMPAEQAGSMIVYAVAHDCPEKSATYLPPA